MHFYERVGELERESIPFAVAIVVSRRSPVSSHVGDRAIVFADGRMEGFVGGSCSRDIVRRHAIEAIGNGTPRLLHISPEPPSARAANGGAGDRIFVPMSCSSEGAADIYIEPHLPARRLLVAGFTPVAHALARAASALDFDVIRVVDDGEISDASSSPGPVVTVAGLRALIGNSAPGERARTSAVVASLGHYDEAVLAALLDANLPFVGLVASRKRSANVLGVLRQEGRTSEELSAIRTPVGLDIGARTAGDVAVSILAEIVAAFAASTGSSAGGGEEMRAAQVTAVDPICGMDVEIATARHRFEFADRTYYFCAAGCRAAFAADPAAALASAAGA